MDVDQTGEESWVVMADPEGNEFCVLRALALADGRVEGVPD
ncbi:MAG: VOC family protein [Acidimicrobiia bacterium]